MIDNAQPNKPVEKKNRGRATGNPDIAELGRNTRFKTGNNANPEGMPKIRTNAVYWAAKYSQFTTEEIKKELARTNLKAVQVAVLRDWLEMMKNPSKANFAWARLKEQYERDEPIESTPPLQDINITIVRK
jgi:hypothetical protein